MVVIIYVDKVIRSLNFHRAPINCLNSFCSGGVDMWLLLSALINQRLFFYISSEATHIHETANIVRLDTNKL